MTSIDQNANHMFLETNSIKKDSHTNLMCLSSMKSSQFQRMFSRFGSKFDVLS